MNDHINPVIPVKGMGVTELQYSDRDVYTITEVDPNGKWFKCKEDTATIDKEKSDKEWPHKRQVYTYEFNPKAPEITVTRRKDGCWRKAGQSSAGSMKRCVFILNTRAKYYDFTF